MSNKLVKGVIFDGKARVTVIKITDLLNEEIKLHSLSPIATVALGRSMIFGAYICTNLKTEGATFSMTINGGGEIGNIVVAGESGNVIRGFVSNPSVDFSDDKLSLSVAKAVGSKGTITVIKDLGLKQPYMGKCELKNGELTEDFSFYLAKSEGINSAFAGGVILSKDGCLSAGGIIIEALPGISEDMLFVTEDIMSNFDNIASLLSEKEPEEVLDFYFGHLDSEIFPSEEVVLKCSCSPERIERLIFGLGREEAEDIIREQGIIEVSCQFCEKKYRYGEEELKEIWKKYCL